MSGPPIEQAKRSGVPRQENKSQTTSSSDTQHGQTDLFQPTRESRAAALEAAKNQGIVKGHRVGFDQGYLAGYSDGLRSSNAYCTGHSEGWRDGYMDALADQRAMRSGAV